VTLEGAFLGIIAAFSEVERVFADRVKALGPLDLEVAEGEFLSLVGPSGCGKSTALRIIAGLIAPTSGTVAWPKGKPRIGFVFQDATLMPWAKVRDNVRGCHWICRVWRKGTPMRARRRHSHASVLPALPTRSRARYRAACACAFRLRVRSSRGRNCC